MRRTAIFTLAAAAGVSAFGASLEFKWDNGSPSYAVNSMVTWVQAFGNDFDVSTLKTKHVAVKRFRLYTTDDWPDGGWDGFYLGLYDFHGGPGARIWPPGGSFAFFKPTGTGWGWYDYGLDFPLPGDAFLAAAEPAGSWPDCDPLMADTNRTPRRHTWLHYGGIWMPYTTSLYGYCNLMLRVVVETGAIYPGVAPSSWGRLKALYY
jgi:hypothetical protein